MTKTDLASSSTAVIAQATAERDAALERHTTITNQIKRLRSRHGTVGAQLAEARHARTSQLLGDDGAAGAAGAMADVAAISAHREELSAIEDAITSLSSQQDQAGQAVHAAGAALERVAATHDLATVTRAAAVARQALATSLRDYLFGEFKACLQAVRETDAEGRAAAVRVAKAHGQPESSGNWNGDLFATPAMANVVVQLEQLTRHADPSIFG